MRPAIWESFPQAGTAASHQKSGHVRGRDRQRAYDVDLVARPIAPTPGSQPLWFTFNVSFWFWFTVVFANFAEAVAEGRGKAQAATLRKMRKETNARRLASTAKGRNRPASALRKGDTVIVEAGEIIPGDGDVIEGIASVDESAITGESAPVIRESGGDRSAVTGGTKVLSDRIVVRITASPGESFLDRMIALVEGAERQKTPNEIALNILLAGLTLGFSVCLRDLGADGALFGRCHGFRHGDRRLAGLFDSDDDWRTAFRYRHRRHRPLAQKKRSGDERPRGRSSGRRRYVAAGQNRYDYAWVTAWRPNLFPSTARRAEMLADAAQLSSLADETPEGRSIVVLAKEKYGLRGREVTEIGAQFIPFSAETRMSGCDLDGRKIRKGAVDAIAAYVSELGGTVGSQIEGITHGISRYRRHAAGGRPRATRFSA